MIESSAYARAGLIGNPSDGYYGKTISFIVSNFKARVWCAEANRLQVVPGPRDPVDFGSLSELAADVDQHGYYGGLRLLKASLKRFFDYTQEMEIQLPARNCRLWYDSDIPLRVGLAGSSAIVTATFKALMKFYGINIPKPVLPRVIMEVETVELGIPAGFQDRVIQVYGGCVYMDFEQEYLEQHGHGRYEEIPLDLLPPIYVAYLDDLSEGTEVFHNDIRSRWEHKDPEVRQAMETFAQYAHDAKEALLNREYTWLGRLMDMNFDLRASLYQLSARNHELVQTARRLGCSSKFAGSGGAVVGIMPDPEVYPRLEKAYQDIGAKVIKPVVVAV